jgi:putative transposase
MREAGLVGAYPRRRRRKTTVQDPRAAAAPDLVGRQFRAEGPNRLWVADLVQVPTGEGWLYLGCPVSEGCVHFMGLAPDHDLSSP